MAAGLPVLASEVGGLPEMVGEQATLPPRDAERWAAAMQRAVGGRASGDASAARRRSTRARELFGAERFYSGLMEVYARARPRA